MMDREQYLRLLRDLLSNDPKRVREANRVLFGTLVSTEPMPSAPNREADLVLAEVPQPC